MRIYPAVFTRGMSRVGIFPYWGIPGPAFHVAITHFGLMVGYSFYLLFKGIKNSTGIMRNRLVYVSIGTALGYFGGSTNYFTWYRIPIPPFLNIFVSLYVLFVGYAIVRLGFMEIIHTFRELIIYIVSSIMIGSVFVGLSLMSFNKVSVMLLILLMATIMPWGYALLRKHLLPYVDEYIFKGRFDYLHKLSVLSAEWAQYKTTEDLCKNLIKDITATLEIEKTMILLYSKTEHVFLQKAFRGYQNEQKVIDEQNVIVTALMHSRSIINKSNLLIERQKENADEILKAVERFDAELIVPIFENKSLTGMLILGVKKNRGIYNQSELDYLEKIATDLSILLRYAESIDIQSETVYRYSHDLKNPLAPVQAYLYMLLNGKAGALTDQQMEFLQLMDKNIQFVSQGLIDMYEISKLTHTDQHDHIQFEKFDINAVLRLIVGSYQAQAHEKNIELTFMCEPGELMFYGYEYGIEQMMRNFIQNAFKFTNEGRIQIDIDNQETYIIIKIRDTGRGIPEKDVPYIFKPFFRTKGQDSIVEGSGLGLAIAREIVILHKGRITVASRENEGTLFTIILPFLPEDTAHQVD